MRQFACEKYKRLVENSSNPIIQNYMKAELEMILKIQPCATRTFVYLGAGYGRILPQVSAAARNVIAIEINPEMLSELRARAAKAGNVKVLKKDFTKLSDILRDEDIINPVLLLMFNTLGTVEGDQQKTLSEMRKVRQQYGGSAIVSLFRAQALRSFGMKLYRDISEMTGEPDMKKIDFERGLFVSKTGYTSKWWSDEEIKQMKDFIGGRVVDEAYAPEWYVMRLDF